jgi:hypothetical protein
MSFVQWVMVLALVLLAAGGAYGGVGVMVSRKVEVPPYQVQGRGALLFGLLYFAGGSVALAAMSLVLLAAR